MKSVLRNQYVSEATNYFCVERVVSEDSRIIYKIKFFSSFLLIVRNLKLSLLFCKSIQIFSDVPANSSIFFVF